VELIVKKKFALELDILGLLFGGPLNVESLEGE
jgi:hypothetical protein